jgi:hypothetical protein
LRSASLYAWSALNGSFTIAMEPPRPMAFEFTLAAFIAPPL